MTVTIAGITGQLAQLIAKHLLALPKGDIRINGLCRTPSKVPKTLSQDARVTIFQSTADDTSTIRQALKSSQVAICCYLGDIDFMTTAQIILVDACIAENVPRYVAGDWSLDFRGLALGDHPLKDPMKHVAAYLEQKAASSQIKPIHILNACFLEAPWRGIWDAQNNALTYWGAGDEKWELTSYSDAAAFTARVVADPDASGWFSFRGDQASVHDMAAAFEKVYKPAQPPELVCKGSLDDLYRTMQQVRQAKPHNMWAWIPMFYTYYSINGQTKLPEPLDNDKYKDIQCETVEEFFLRTPLKRLGKPITS